MRQYGISLILLLLGMRLSAEPVVLPEPLTLDFALAQAGTDQDYQMLDAESLLEQTRALVHQANSLNEWKANLQLQGAVFEPSPLATDQSTEEFNARLQISRPLYDAGRSDWLQASASLQNQATREYLAYALAQRRLQIARAYVDVLLADLKFVWDNEAMAIAYVQFDNAREKHALRQISDVDLLAADNAYQQVRYQRMMSEIEQRNSRAFLAEAINRPGELSSELQRPLFRLQRELPEYERLVEQVLQHNPGIRLLQSNVESARLKMQAVREPFQPDLTAAFEVYQSNVERSSPDDWRASLILNIPLLDQHDFKSQMAAERSQWMKQRAMLLQEQTRLRQRVLQLWQQIRLLNTRLEQMQTRVDYNELYLDRSRALYEMEVKTDLGDAMVTLSETRYLQAQAEFGLALAWMELDILTHTDSGVAEQ